MADFEFRHADPSAFHVGDGWKKVPQFGHTINLSRFEYRIYGTVYYRNTEEFRKAVDSYFMMQKLKDGVEPNIDWKF